MISSLILFVTLGLTATTTDQTVAANCDTALTEVAKKGRELDSHSLALKNGERVFTPEAQHYTLDAGTVADLDLDNLVFPLLNKTKTVFGAERLSWLLHHPTLDVQEIRVRQEAVSELISDPKLFAEVSAILSGLNASAEAINDHFLGDQKYRTNIALAMGAGLFAPLITGSTFGSAIIARHWQYAFMGLMPVMMIQTHLASQLEWARWYLLHYKNLFESSAKLAGLLSKAKSPVLQKLAQEMMPADAGDSFALTTKMFQKLLTQKQSTALDWIYSHSAWTLSKPAKAIEREREKISKLLGAVSELDVFSSFAEIASSHSGQFIFPTLRDSNEPRLLIDRGNNPYIYLTRGETSVPNDIRLNSSSSRNSDEINFLILTGPNMGGKSTYLKMASISAIMAQMGAPVFAKRMEMTPLQIVTNINVSDSIAQGKSFFDAETDRLKEIIDMTEYRPGMLVIMDEILLGTNPEEREAAERAIIHYLASKKQLFVLATHDLRVTELSQNVSGVANFHVEEQVDQGKLIFSYKVKTGPTPARNAITVLKIKGFPRQVTEEAQQWLDRKKAAN
ncbi:MAG: methionine transporter substrate-binding protein [Bacteriovoracaceae bacterium]|nr:methionine transporter substrate-binding protein [Bacteriovoracaceae bacterium]